MERELSDETEVEVGGQALKTEVRPTSVRLGAGGVFEVGERVVVRATAGYRTSGSGTSGYGGGLEVQVRFQARAAEHGEYGRAGPMARALFRSGRGRRAGGGGWAA